MYVWELHGTTQHLGSGSYRIAQRSDANATKRIFGASVFACVLALVSKNKIRPLASE